MNWCHIKINYFIFLIEPPRDITDLLMFEFQLYYVQDLFLQQCQFPTTEVLSFPPQFPTPSLQLRKEGVDPWELVLLFFFCFLIAVTMPQSAVLCYFWLSLSAIFIPFPMSHLNSFIPLGSIFYLFKGKQFLLY